MRSKLKARNSLAILALLGGVAAVVFAVARADSTSVPDLACDRVNVVATEQGELAATPSGNNWFTDKYLAAVKTASTISK